MLNPNEYFEPLSEAEKTDEYQAMEARTFWKDAWERFCSNKRSFVGLIILAVVVLIVLIGPFISPYPYDGMDVIDMLQGPSAAHWFGTDQMGRDEFTRVLYGARISLMIGFVATAVNVLLGIIYGGIAGYAGGAVDIVMVRIMDIINSIPAMIYMILIMLLLGSNVYSVMIGICVNGWIDMARVVRGQIISLKEREFATAAFVLGVPRKRILFKHLMINAMGPIIVTATLMVPQAIFNEAFLSFIGIGISAPQASLGTLAQDAKMMMSRYPMQMVYPVLTICLVIFALNFIGEGLEEAFNPKGRN